MARCSPRARTPRCARIPTSSKPIWARNKMLTVEGLSGWYGQAQVPRNVHLEVAAGQLVTLVGRNGAGKSTTLRCIMGLHRQMQGRICLDGADIAALPPHRRARLGLGYVPDDRGIYSSLSVEENLTLPPAVGPDAW